SGSRCSGCCIASSQCVCRPLTRPGNLRLVRSVSGCESWFRFRSQLKLAMQDGVTLSNSSPSLVWASAQVQVPKYRCPSRCEPNDMVTIVGPSKLSPNQSVRRPNEKKLMGTHTHRALRCIATSRAGRMAIAAVSIAIWTGTIEVSHAADVPAPSAAKLERITEFFNNEVATGKLPGAVVLIQQHGKPVYLKCFGVRDVATNLPMTSDTIFALHSMTKPITSVAAMMLIDAGKLSLADRVSKFIPAFADVKVGVSSATADGTPVLKLVPPDRPVTIMDLLRHTSGITYDYIGGKLIMKAYSESGLFDGRYNNKVFADRIARLPLAR